MQTLSRFLPAQTLMLTDSSSSLKELLKVTFMDLLFTRVLQTKTTALQSHPRNPVRYITYVEQGMNFRAYKPKPHEAVFLLPYFQSPDAQVLFRHLVRMGYENSGGQQGYRGLLINDLSHEGLLVKRLWDYLFGSYSLTDQGEQVKERIAAEMLQLTETLPVLITEDREKALEVLAAIRGNVFLLQGFDLALLRHVDQVLQEQVTKGSYYADAEAEWVMIGGWDFFEDYSGEFDSSCGGDSGSGGGDSGCSGGGCSGCGGCGGCGS